MRLVVIRKSAGDKISVGYLVLLDRCFHPLAENPNQGQRCDEIRSGYRKFPSGQHIIFYCEQNIGGIEIIRVLHERMDLEVHL